MNDLNPGNSVLVDAPLVPDMDADSELSGDGTFLIGDEDICGARFVLQRSAVEPVVLSGVPGAFAAFVCTFHGTGEGARFTNAEVYLVLDAPEGAQFIDVEPTIDAVEEVTVEYSIAENLNVKVLESGSTTTHRVTTYVARIKGSGERTPRARWTLEEGLQNGIPHKTSLLCTFTPAGPIKARAIVSARIERRGAGGALLAARNLFLGPHQWQYPFTLDIPAAEGS